MKPTKKDRKKFDLDLEYGSIREEKIADMLTNKKIEVKSERGMWMKTGNICIEYESWNKPSGIRATESDYWFHNLCVGKKTYATLVFEVDSLKEILESLPNKISVKGGDHFASRMYLINLQKLFDIKTIKEYVNIK